MGNQMSESDSGFDEQWLRIESFHEVGTIQEFLGWLDSDEGQDWMSPMYENWLIRRDTVRDAAFAVMRRSVER